MLSVPVKLYHKASGNRMIALFHIEVEYTNIVAQAHAQTFDINKATGTAINAMILTLLVETNVANVVLTNLMETNQYILLVFPYQTSKLNLEIGTVVNAMNLTFLVETNAANVVLENMLMQLVRIIEEIIGNPVDPITSTFLPQASNLNLEIGTAVNAKILTLPVEPNATNVVLAKLP
eukprot:TRINITY_DN3160_c2_g4_i2.p1 TRINITY_DN3160_c2_g4~~TRINITY_DN3160_c2_g4_i2.p1  ORF type:complete len:178 (-),score=24.31 TRINITY_DN3160_c2_g4_i2:1000-1533(-)